MDLALHHLAHRALLLQASVFLHGASLLALVLIRPGCSSGSVELALHVLKKVQLHHTPGP